MQKHVVELLLKKQAWPLQWEKIILKMKKEGLDGRQLFLNKIMKHMPSTLNLLKTNSELNA